MSQSEKFPVRYQNKDGTGKSKVQKWLELGQKNTPARGGSWAVIRDDDIVWTLQKCREVKDKEPLR